MTETWPQPWEGINGVIREDDDLLSLEDAAVSRRQMMIGLARCLCSATLVGNPAPVVRRMGDRMRAPQPGDLVFERTMTRRGGDNALKGFGILLAKRREWWETDEEWAAEIERERAAYDDFLRGPYSHPGDGPFDPSSCERRTDEAWYVQYGPGERDICRWENAEFTAIPVDDEEFRIQVGTRDGNGVTFVRDDLVTSLADSGFVLRRPGDGQIAEGVVHDD